MIYKPIDNQTTEEEAVRSNRLEEYARMEEPHQVLDSMQYNNFENLLVAMESFLQGFEICD